MPRKNKKTKEEGYAESYFPVDIDDLRFSIEKPVKERIPEEKIISIKEYNKDKENYSEDNDIYVEKEFKKKSIEEIEKVEKKGKKKVKKKVAKKKTRKKKSSKKKVTKKKIDYKAPNVKLKTNGYELVITEKPQAASKIANALGKAVMKTKSKVPYYEVNRNGHKIVVACAVGHLFTLKQSVTGSDVPVFEVKWIPNYLVRKNDYTKRYYDLILNLVKSAGSITIATDYDVEGEVIGLNVMRFLCNQKDANRMKFSTLTPKELDKAYIEKSGSINWGQAIAGETRHYLDWFYGINLSRALMNAIKTTGRFRIMSIGRVQGPALNMIVKKEKEIKKFKPEPYWQVFIKVDSKNKIELKYFKDIFDKEFLNKFEGLENEEVNLEVKSTERKTPPNIPFNLTTLQTEAYKFYGITPANTLKAAQSLYLGGLISYPRTSSQQLPESIDYKSILKKLANEYKVKHLIKRKTPIQGKKKDPAHPSIYPTGNTQILSSDEEKIYNLIVRRFLSLFCEDAIIENKKITAIPVKENKKDLKFVLNGSSIKKKAWMEIYPSKLKETELPEIKDKGKIIKLWTEEKETQPPKRYSQASIISQLEKKNLGTKCLTKDNFVVINNKLENIEKIFLKSDKHSKEKQKEIRKINIDTISLEKKENPVIKKSKFISRRRINKNERVIKIETYSCIMKLTEDHLVYIFKRGKIKEIPAKNIKKDDYLIAITKNNKKGDLINKKDLFQDKYKVKNNEILHKFSSKGNKGILESKIPIKWSTSLAWILGYFYGDGSYDGPKYNGSHSISFSTTQEKALKLLKKYSKEIFGRECYAYNLGRKYKVDFNSVISYFLIRNFPELDGKKVFKIKKEFIGDFLRGFFDADGNVHLRPKGDTIIKGIHCKSFDTPRVKISLAREDLIYWIKDLLNEIGIETKVNKGISTCNGKKFNCWTILISGRDKIEKFAYEVGFDSNKEKILYKGLKCNSRKYKIIKNSALIFLILQKGDKKIKEIINETKLSRQEIIFALRRMYKLGLINKKRYTNRNKWVYSAKKEHHKYFLHCIKLIYTQINKDIYKIPIKNISQEEYNGYVYDLSVDKDSPNFIIQGNILVHNSTRSSILETLYDRNYVKDKSIEATPLGVSLIETLEKYSPVIINEKLTRNFEKEMEKIANSKKDYTNKQKNIIEKAKKTIKKISNDFKENEKEIGKNILRANIEQQEQQKIDNKLCKCPKCKKGDLAITYSRKTKRFFIACDAYPDCKTTYSLPPNGVIKKTEKICEKCGFPMLMRLSKGKRPWIFCFNPLCETNAEWTEKRKEYKVE